MRATGLHPLTRRFFFDGLNAPADPTSGFAKVYSMAPGGAMTAGEMDTTDRVIPMYLQFEHRMRNGDITRIGPSVEENGEPGGAGQHIENYVASPSVFVGHCTMMPAVARAENVRQVLDGKPFPFTIADVKFHADPLNEEAQLQYVLYRDKIQNAGSTGIWCMAWEVIREEGQEGVPDWCLPWDITESELMEYSLVGIPNDPMALIANGAPAAAVDLTSRVMNAANLGSKKDGIAHARAVARYLVNTFGREAFAEILDVPKTSEAPIEPPALILPPSVRKISEADLDLLAGNSFATL